MMAFRGVKFWLNGTPDIEYKKDSYGNKLLTICFEAPPR